MAKITRVLTILFAIFASINEHNCNIIHDLIKAAEKTINNNVIKLNHARLEIASLETLIEKQSALGILRATDAYHRLHKIHNDLDRRVADLDRAFANIPAACGELKATSVVGFKDCYRNHLDAINIDLTALREKCQVATGRMTARLLKIDLKNKALIPKCTIKVIFRWIEACFDREFAAIDTEYELLNDDLREAMNVSGSILPMQTAEYERLFRDAHVDENDLIDEYVGCLSGRAWGPGTLSRELLLMGRGLRTFTDGSETLEVSGNPEELSTTPQALSSPRDWPTTPEELSTTPEVPRTTEDLSTAPDASSTTRNIPSTSEAPSTPEDLSTTPEAHSTPEELSTTPEDLSTTPEDLSTTSEDLSTTPEASTTPEEPSTTSKTSPTPTEEPTTTYKPYTTTSGPRQPTMCRGV